MAYRTAYGNTHSENGWRMVDTGSCKWIQVPGTNGRVSLQIHDGQPLAILRAFAADFNAYIEPLRDRDSACWTATNSVSTSNHLSGTALDLNWDGPDYPARTKFRFGISEREAYPPPKDATLRELLAFYEGMVFCGGNWDIRDWMHFQMGYNTYNNPKTQSFIDRKIRSDGFSTFRRGVITAKPIEIKPGQPSQPKPEEGFMSALSAEEQRALYNEIMKQRSSSSPLRHVGEGTIGNNQDIDSYMDANIHVLVVDLLARLGDPNTLSLLNTLGNIDITKHPDRKGGRDLALAILENARRLSASSASQPVVVPPQQTYVQPQSTYVAPVEAPSEPFSQPILPPVLREESVQEEPVQPVQTEMVVKYETPAQTTSSPASLGDSLYTEVDNFRSLLREVTNSITQSVKGNSNG